MGGYEIAFQAQLHSFILAIFKLKWSLWEITDQIESLSLEQGERMSLGITVAFTSAQITVTTEVTGIETHHSSLGHFPRNKVSYWNFLENILQKNFSDFQGKVTVLLTLHNRLLLIPFWSPKNCFCCCFLFCKESPADVICWLLCWNKQELFYTY